MYWKKDVYRNIINVKNKISRITVAIDLLTDIVGHTYTQSILSNAKHYFLRSQALLPDSILENDLSGYHGCSNEDDESLSQSH